MKVVITNDNHPQSSMRGGTGDSHLCSPSRPAWDKNMEFDDLDDNFPTDSSRKANALFAYMQTLEGFLCLPFLSASGSAHLCHLRHEQIFQSTVSVDVSAVSVDALNIGTSLISSLLKIVHMLFFIILRNLASVLLSWTVTQ